ncbi:MAG: hypothetical protein ACRESJ_22800 [Pseudomonas sp.]|uniref:hypothetical protein n=1 Tax=Pseudomonas sp. TaxID=306 RepID=UPI003D6FD276
MSTNREGHLCADVTTGSGDTQLFRVTNGLEFYVLLGSYRIDASNGKGKEFYIQLPGDIESGSFNLGLSPRGPMIIHVTGSSEAEVYQGNLELKVGGDAQFAGTFSGIDIHGLKVTNGSFRLEHETSA